MSVQSYYARRFLCATACATAILSVATGLQAAPLPGPADAGRIDQREGVRVPEPNLLPPVQQKAVVPLPSVPENSRQVRLTLRNLRIVGMSVFAIDDVKDIYAPYLDREVTLDTVWKIAGQLTEHYHDAGYFLARVTVPQQEIKDGVVVLRVVEGYVGEVKLDDPLAEKVIVKEWIDKILSCHPVKAEQIESALLHLNDLPGVNLRAVMEPIERTEEDGGAVRLILERKKTPLVSGTLGFDNNGSRFLGPYEAQMQAQANFFPMQRTTLALLSSLPWHELKYGSLKHELPVFAGGTVELYGAYTTAMPGYTLKVEDIKSRSTTLGVAFDYSIIRQREENLSGRIAFEAHNIATDMLGATLTKDDIRALRLNLNYQRADAWNGQNMLDGTVSRGVDFLGASQPGQKNLSRANAKPNFTKVDLNASRLQGITQDWTIFTAVSAQAASGTLYASEQFGYGGQAFGRAYDDSEITGDQGVAASAELRYAGFHSWHGFQPVPYEFYDIGAVWNEGQDSTMTYAMGSSAGAGFRILSDIGLSTNFGLAFPLSRRISNPIYGNGKNPRYFIQVSYAF